MNIFRESKRAEGEIINRMRTTNNGSRTSKIELNLSCVPTARRRTHPNTHTHTFRVFISFQRGHKKFAHFQRQAMPAASISDAIKTRHEQRKNARVNVFVLHRSIVRVISGTFKRSPFPHTMFVSMLFCIHSIVDISTTFIFTLFRQASRRRLAATAAATTAIYLSYFAIWHFLLGFCF